MRHKRCYMGNIQCVMVLIAQKQKGFNGICSMVKMESKKSTQVDDLEFFDEIVNFLCYSLL